MQGSSRLSLASLLLAQLPLLLGRGETHPRPSPGWSARARSPVCAGISLSRAVPGEVWVCGQAQGMWEVCLAPGILPAAICVVWVLALYLGSRLSSHPAGQASSSWIPWCPRECQKALVPVAAACFGWENSFLSLFFEFSIYSKVWTKKEEPALCQQNVIEVLLISGGKLRHKEVA